MHCFNPPRGHIDQTRSGTVSAQSSHRNQMNQHLNGQNKHHIEDEISPQQNEFNFSSQQGNQNISQSLNDEVKPKRLEILVMTVDIGNGQSGKIHVFENDDPYTLASQFVSQYGLPSCIVEILEENIQQNVSQVLKSKQNAIVIYNPNIFQCSNYSFDPFLQSFQQENCISSQDNENNSSPKDGHTSSKEVFGSAYQSNYPSYSQKEREHESQGQQKHISKYCSNKSNAVQSASDSFEGRQSFKVNQNEGHTPSTKRINKDYPDITSSMKRRIYYPEGIVEKIDNQSFERYLGINGQADGTQSVQNRSIMGGLSHINSYQHEMSIGNQIISNNNFSRQEDSGKMNANKSFDFGRKSSVHERLFAHSKIKNLKQRDNERSQSSQHLNAKKVQRSNSRNDCDNRLPFQCCYINTKRTELITVFVCIREDQSNEKCEKRLMNKRRQKKQVQLILNAHIILRSMKYPPSLLQYIQTNIMANLRNEPVGDFLQKVARQQRERKERARSFKLSTELNGCSFRPEINQISNQIAKERMNILLNHSMENGKAISESFVQNRYDQLYEDSKNKIERKIQRDRLFKIDTNCTFKPQINTFSKILMHDVSFFERQQRYNSKENYNIQNANNLTHIDPSTGQELFRPVIGRPPKKQRAKDNQSVGEYLYEQHKNKQLQLKQRSDQQKSGSRQSGNSPANKSSVTCQQSNKIMDCKKRQKLTDIFNLLDSDHDGEISAQAIEIQYLDPMILETFSPLLCEMEELEQSLTLEEFIDASEKLIQGLNIQEKHQLFNTQKRKDSSESFDFRPRLNPNSMKIAQGKRPYGSPAFYDVFLGEKQQFEEKIKLLREIKNQQELEGCTFTPNITPLFSNLHFMPQNSHINSSNYQSKQPQQNSSYFSAARGPSYFYNQNEQEQHYNKGYDQRGYCQNEQPLNFSTFSYQDYQRLLDNNNNSNSFLEDKNKFNQNVLQKHYENNSNEHNNLEFQ